jgi:hypothetical protein
MSTIVWGFSKQAITLMNNLYTNASSCIKWKNQISKSMISIEQGVRQGGALSADLYKVYSFISSIFDFLHVFIGITTLFCGWSRYPSLLLKSKAMSTIVWISKGLFAIPISHSG